MPTFSKFTPTRFGEFGQVRFFYDTPIPSWFLPDKTWLIRAVLFRQKLQMNTFLLIVGGVRTGKSYCGLEVIEECSNVLKVPFDVEKQVSFELRPFLEWSKTASYSFFMLDEIGVSLSTSDWWTLQSKIMRNFTQTQGFRGNVLIMTVPNVAFFQKHFRFMCNYGVEIISHGNATVYKIVVKHLIGKASPHFLGTMKIDLPSQAVVDKYTQMKVEWNDRKLKEDLDWLDERNNPEIIERKFSYQDYIDFYKNDVIPETALREKLTKFNFRAEDVEALITNESIKKQEETTRRQQEMARQEETRRNEALKKVALMEKEWREKYGELV
jgi:hypothetical protein